MGFSLSDKDIIVNYHYVEDEGRNHGIHPCSTAEFARQIKFLSENYKIATIPEVYNSAKKSGGERTCAITFDDGLKDQYVNAVPVLKQYGANATFFIITATFEGFIPAPHRAHILFSQHDSEKILDAANDFFAGRRFIIKDHRLTDKRPGDDIFTANFKETVAALPVDERGQLLDELFRKLNSDSSQTASSIFMNTDEVRDLHRCGFSVNGHTHKHESLDSISQEEIKETLRLSIEYLQKLLGVFPEVFCYPSGRVNDEAVVVVRESGMKFAVTIVPRAVVADDNPLLIPRYDTNDIRDFLNKQYVE